MLSISDDVAGVEEAVKSDLDWLFVSHAQFDLLSVASG